MKYYVQIFYIDSRDMKRRVVIERSSQDDAELAAAEICRNGVLRIEPTDRNSVEFIPLHRIVLIRVVSEKD